MHVAVFFCLFIMCLLNHKEYCREYHQCTFSQREAPIFFYENNNVTFNLVQVQTTPPNLPSKIMSPLHQMVAVVTCYICFLSKFIFTAKIFPLNFHLHIRKNKQNTRKKETDSLISLKLADFIERVFVIENSNGVAEFCADICLLCLLHL